MGGHAVGEKASAKAVQDIPHLYQKHAREGIIPALRRAFTETNAGIHAIGQENPEFRGSGTTSTALVLRPEGAWVGHVGDSRCYRGSDGLTGVVTPQEVGAVVTALPPDDAARLLVHMANLRGGPDNITVLIVQVPGGNSEGKGGKGRRPGTLKRA